MWLEIATAANLEIGTDSSGFNMNTFERASKSSIGRFPFRRTSSSSGGMSDQSQQSAASHPVAAYIAPQNVNFPEPRDNFLWLGSLVDHVFPPFFLLMAADHISAEG